MSDFKVTENSYDHDDSVQYFVSFRFSFGKRSGQYYNECVFRDEKAQCFFANLLLNQFELLSSVDKISRYEVCLFTK